LAVLLAFGVEPVEGSWSEPPLWSGGSRGGGGGICSSDGRCGWLLGCCGNISLERRKWQTKQVSGKSALSLRKFQTHD